MSAVYSFIACCNIIFFFLVQIYLEAVTSKMVNSSVMSSKASTSSSADPSSSEVSGPAYGEEEVGMRSRNLSSTLHKLYLLEKKLYSEVKVCM